ncbi:MAG: NAD-dependent epimerase/dehydratase family protein [Bacteroidota bacterium]
MNNQLSLITGSNGHLGNNLLRLLLSKSIPTRASVRDLSNTAPFEDLSCEIVQADLLDKDSLVAACRGVKNVYAVGAAFSMWAKDPQTEIYDVNVQGTRNLFEAAQICGVKNIVYVSSIAALDFTHLPAKESNGYNKDRRNIYYNSKNDSDKLALELGKRYGIRTVIILPSAMIGREAHKLSYSNRLVWQILKGKIPLDTHISLNWIDVKDVAEAAYVAMLKGGDGERYILANENHTSIQKSVKIAAELFPELKLSIPKKAPKWLLYVIAACMELASKLTEKEPLLQKEYIDMFYGLKQDFDISKARKELNFNPTSSEKALESALAFLKNEWKGGYLGLTHYKNS